nr:uncharacterized protein LOC124810907 [Hydra vulgaris]
MSKLVKYETIVMMRELLNVQKETMMSFFKKTVKDFNLHIEALQQNINGLSNDLEEIKTGMNFFGDLYIEKIKTYEEKIKQRIGNKEVNYELAVFKKLVTKKSGNLQKKKSKNF